MRELSLVEIESVSGAGKGADIGSQVGSLFGDAFDRAYRLITGKNSPVSQVNPLTEIGTGIGYLVDSKHHGACDPCGSASSDRCNGLKNLFKGISDAVSAACTNISSLLCC